MQSHAEESANCRRNQQNLTGIKLSICVSNFLHLGYYLGPSESVLEGYSSENILIQKNMNPRGHNSQHPCLRTDPKIKCKGMEKHWKMLRFYDSDVRF